MDTPDARTRSPIMQILNVFAPSNGANVGQLMTRADGTHQVFGDAGLIEAGLRRLGLSVTAVRSIMGVEPARPHKVRKQRGAAKTAAAVE